MRLAYKLMTGVFLLSMLAGDLAWAEMLNAKKAKAKNSPAAKPKVLAVSQSDEPASYLSVDDRNELTEQLFDISGLKNDCRHVSAASIFDQGQLKYMGLPREEGAIVASIYSKTLNTENYCKDVQDTFKQGMNKRRMEGVAQWFDSPTGRKIVKMEADVRTLDISQKVAAMTTEFQNGFPSRNRLALIKKLEKSMDATSTFVTLNLSQLQAFLPLDKEFEGEPMKALHADLKGSVWIQPLQERMLLSLLYAYKELSDDELAFFVEFAESQDGTWFYKLKKKAVMDAQTRINAKVAEPVESLKQALKSGEGKMLVRKMLPPGTRYLFAQGRDPFLPLSHMKSEVSKVQFTRLLSQGDEDEGSDGKKGKGASKKQRFGAELQSLHTIPLEIYKSLKQINNRLYQDLEHYAFLFKDKKELMAMDNTAYLDAVASYKGLIEKTNKMKGEIILPSPLQVPYDSLKPSGVIWSQKEPMALVETSDKLGFTVHKGSLVGPAYGVVESIDQNKIVVVERERDYLGNIMSKSKEIDFYKSNKNEGKP